MVLTLLLLKILVMNFHLHAKLHFMKLNILYIYVCDFKFNCGFHSIIYKGVVKKCKPYNNSYKL